MTLAWMTTAGCESAPAWRALPAALTDQALRASRATVAASARVRASVRSDVRKRVVFTVMIAAASAWCGRTVFGRKAGPAAAQAAVAPAQSDQIDARHSSQISAMETWAQRPISPPSRNFFRLGNAQSAGVYGGVRFWEAVAKSVGPSADQLKERKRRFDQITEEANQLRVQLTVMGRQPKAVINGRSVGEGEIVASFRIVRIEARRVIVEREGIKLEIGMR